MKMWRALKEGRNEDARAVHDQIAAVLNVMGRYLGAHGRRTFCEVMQLRGLPVKRFPRWECLPFTDQERAELKQGLEETGVSLALP